MLSSADFSFQEIEEDSEHSHVYKIDEPVYEALTTAFGDRSPIHVDQEYAKAAGFPNCVMHGAILQGFLSHFVGMRFPGKRSLILSVNLNYLLPSFLEDEIELTARVRRKVETGQVVMMDVRFLNTASNAIVASGKVQVALRNE
jgi:acyl dehydratase